MEKPAAWSSCRLMVATSIAAFQVSGAPDGDEQASDGDAEKFQFQYFEHYAF